MPVGGYSTSCTPVCSEVPRWEWYWRTSDRNDGTALATLASLQEVESSSVTPAPVRKAPTSRLMALDSWRVLVTNRERNHYTRIRSRRAPTGWDSWGAPTGFSDTVEFGRAWCGEREGQ